MPELQKVLTPLVVRQATLRSRVASTAHITGFARAGLVTPELVDYHRARARGGIGLIVTETGSVHPSYRPQGIQYFAPGVGEGLAEIASAVHEHGAKVFGQLNHGGAQSPPLPDGSLSWSASDNDGQFGRPARGITRAEIADLIEHYVSAATILAGAGYDGCEVHGAHSYLVNHFLSPLYNRRTDEYGGSFEGRLTLVRQIITGIRAAVGDTFVIGVRLGAEIGPGGLGSKELAEIGLRLEELGLIDYASFSLGGRTPESYPLMTGTMDRPAGYELEWNEVPSRALTVPTIVTGRYRTLAEADATISAGAADVVGMTRAHIADPEIVAKTAAGDAGGVRPCIGCNECQGALLTAGSIRCAVNATLPEGIGTNGLTIAPTAVGRRVLVVGGGPAGLEAARVAALRGYTVTLVERSEELGGVARTSALRMPNALGMAEMSGWLAREVRRLGVDVRLGQEVDAEYAARCGADVVLVATGSVPRLDGVQSARPGQIPTGLDRAGVVSSMEALQLSADTAGRSALIVDDLGEYEAIGVAEYLLDLGLEVTVVTPFPSLGAPIDATYRPLSALGRFGGTGRFTVRPTSMLYGVEPGGTARVVFLPSQTEQTIAADTVVLITRNRPANDLSRVLAESGIGSILIGDALTPRNFRAAIADGNKWEQRVEVGVRV